MGVGTQKKKIKRTQPQNNYFGVNSYETVDGSGVLVLIDFGLLRL